MKEFKKYFLIKALPQDVYAALTNPEIIAIWTGEKAEMSVIPESEFEWWNGDICGKNIEFEQDKKIVQQWYFGEEDTDRPSVVTLKLHADKKGTSLEVHQTNIPDEAFGNITEGWQETIVNSICDLLEE
jgi:activator of HSP90 ATPase